MGLTRVFPHDREELKSKSDLDPFHLVFLLPDLRGLRCEPSDQDCRLLPDVPHYSSAVSHGGQSHTWRMAALTNGRQEVANLTDIWEVDFFLSA